jgi:cell division GTPase FtsZ
MVGKGISRTQFLSEKNRMRALLIGLGGAGCRIVDTLHRHDERSGVKSVHSFIFDADQKMISEIEGIPRENRYVLTPIDPVKKEYLCGTDFEVGNLASCFQRDGIEEIDAVFVCAGLGGRMAELVPTVVAQLNNAFEDPVFTILTMPGKNEGVKVSARASGTLAEIRKISQASILFDNETWFRRIEEEEHPEGKIRKSTIYEMYPSLNEMLARRVGLLLRAGEFNHKGVDAAEVVLDAGEVLNTLKKMDIIAIGYATERLPPSWNGVMKKVRAEKYMLEENQARTSRIVELAKQAVYREVSVPCDLTSANKALILIAGPSDELSMKGFQTVRKWIDRSIKGLEMRAGDYPVKSTQYVGVIIVLAGIENVPRIAELDEIRGIYEAEQNKVYPAEKEEMPAEGEQITEDKALFEEVMVMTLGIRRTEMPDGDDEIFEIGDTPAAGEEDIPETEVSVLPQTEEEDIFSGEPAGYNEDDVFEEGTVQDEGDDVFEETVRRIVPPPEYYRQPVYEGIPQPEEVREVRPPEPKRPPMPKISVGGPKKQKQITGDSIMLPKREKKEDSVLSGMAHVGGNDKPKDSGMFGCGMADAGVRGRPKETMGPGVLEGSVTVKGGRPKETDGHIRLGNTQRPKETDGHIRLGNTQRPKETDGHIRLENTRKPKEIGGAAVSGGSVLRPASEIGDAKIRVTKTPLPKNQTTKPVAEKRKWV